MCVGRDSSKVQVGSRTANRERVSFGASVAGCGLRVTGVSDAFLRASRLRALRVLSASELPGVCRGHELFERDDAHEAGVDEMFLQRARGEVLTQPPAGTAEH